MRADVCLHARVILRCWRVFMGLVLLIIVLVLLFGGLPRWGYSRNWGYGPSGGLGLVLVILIVLMLAGQLSYRW
jgi:hypothetical protein